MATKWVEDNLGHGPVVKESFNGSSGWSSAATVTTADGTRFFIKTARGRDAGMFTGEAAGLKAMFGTPHKHWVIAYNTSLCTDTHTIRVPEVFHVGSLDPSGPSLRGGGSFIVMEYLNLSGRYSDANLGHQLARMHLASPTVCLCDHVCPPCSHPTDSIPRRLRGILGLRWTTPSVEPHNPTPGRTIG